MIKKSIYILFIAFIVGLRVSGQENIYEDLLREEVEVENPVYMPVIGIGPGIMNYHGELKGLKGGYAAGDKALKLNVSTFVDKQHYFKGNFFILLLGSLKGEQYNPIAPSQNFNFQSNITTFGFNIQYSFEPIIPKNSPVRPFIALGIEMVQFSSKTDLLASNNSPYIYNTDGTIRDLNGNIIYRDYNYETDLRQDVDFGIKNYAKSSIGFPIDLGLQFNITKRAYLQLGTGFHFTMVDHLDHISSKNTQGIIGKKGNDWYSYTYVTFHFDLFSDPETITVEKLFADIEIDYAMYDDEDNDFVFDKADRCPNTPARVKVDSIGCPFDDDNDGVPNFKDKEANTKPNAFVNEAGQEVNLDELAKMMNAEAVKRDEVKAILKSNLSRKYYSALSGVTIPKKFKPIDKDEDGYIAFEEMLEAIDKFFNFESELTTNDINELKEFFFSQ